MALDSALQNARTRWVFSARHGEWPQAVAHARKAQRHSRRSDEGPQRLEVRMRTVSVLFLAALEEADPEAARGLAGSLETVCQQQIDRWGPDHPRALEALVTMASARHEIARVDGDLAAMDRLTDVLAVAAQRTSTTLGARHPQAKAVQAALARVHEATERARRQQVAAEPTRARQPQAPAPVPQPPVWQQPDAGIPEGELTTAVLELLVHGFDGTSPEEMLGVPQTVQITGDERAAIHRRVEDVEAESHGEGSAGRPVPEAYVWCRSRYEYLARASWLVLLPFTLINLAHWMLPAARGHARAVRVYGLLVRLTSLTLTVLLVAASCEVTLDLAAWQCAGSRGCAQEHSWLRLLSPDVSGGGWWSQPGRRLAVAAVVPAALIGLLWWLSFRTWSAYESQQPVPRSAGSDDDTGHGALSRPGFWYGRRLVARLRAAHVAAGFLTVAAAVGSSAGRYDRAAGHRAGLEVLSWVLDAALGGGRLSCSGWYAAAAEVSAAWTGNSTLS